MKDGTLSQQHSKLTFERNQSISTESLLLYLWHKAGNSLHNAEFQGNQDLLAAPSHLFLYNPAPLESKLFYNRNEYKCVYSCETGEAGTNIFSEYYMNSILQYLPVSN